MGSRRETWSAGRLRVVTGRRCWRQVCCCCALAGAVTGSQGWEGWGAVLIWASLRVPGVIFLGPGAGGRGPGADDGGVRPVTK